MEINERAAKDCEFYGHRYVGMSVCVYCGTENPEYPLPPAFHHEKLT